jgi:hypothetical protein
MPLSWNIITVAVARAKTIVEITDSWMSFCIASVAGGRTPGRAGGDDSQVRR